MSPSSLQPFEEDLSELNDPFHSLIIYVSIVLGESGLDILIDGEQLVVPFLTFDLCMNSSLLMNNFKAYNESIQRGKFLKLVINGMDANLGRDFLTQLRALHEPYAALFRDGTRLLRWSLDKLVSCDFIEQGSTYNIFGDI